MKNRKPEIVMCVIAVVGMIAALSAVIAKRK